MKHSVVLSDFTNKMAFCRNIFSAILQIIFTFKLICIRFASYKAYNLCCTVKVYSVNRMRDVVHHLIIVFIDVITIPMYRINKSQVLFPK